ncbi:ribonuclease HI [Caldovatus aquaticus]|uniref:Ribonuclease H n=1 Tax=Caldovatus aquaticus TaxID=2865671 RepID=A0ABS7EXM2_9PROT|nr:ribonuclease HI [Caldovatus aquaticus]MBW8268104.1 ribonuclease HI [Caldovatus aquaticus]
MASDAAAEGGGAAAAAERPAPARPRRVVEVWTDGGCSPNPGPGGWAAILVSGPHRKELSGAEPHSTNNRMELTAAIAALEALKGPCRVVLHTDSEYLRNGITRWVKDWLRNGWRTASRQPVANRELWQRLLDAAARHEVAWRWVRGHAGDPMNERADRLATEARERLMAAAADRPAPSSRRR